MKAISSSLNSESGNSSSPLSSTDTSDSDDCYDGTDMEPDSTTLTTSSSTVTTSTSTVTTVVSTTSTLSDSWSLAPSNDSAIIGNSSNSTPTGGITVTAADAVTLDVAGRSRTRVWKG